MASSEWSTAFLSRFRSSAWSLRVLRFAVVASHDSTDSEVRRQRSCTIRPGRLTPITPDIARLIDDMIETMYAAPGVGLAAPQIGVPLRIFVVDISVGRDPSGLLVFVNPEIRRTRRHAARGGRLPERSGIRGHRRPAVARGVKGLDRDGAEHQHEGTVLLARAFQHEMDHLDGTLFVDRLRGHQARSDRQANQEDDPRRQMVTGGAAARRVLRHARVRRADARRPARSSPSGGRRRHAARSAARPRPKNLRHAGQSAGARGRPPGAAARAAERPGVSGSPRRACTPTSASSPPTEKS